MKFVRVGLLSLAASVVAFGQSAAINGQIEGTITDPSGAQVPGAKIDIVNKGTGYNRSANTDQSGFFRFPLLPLGAYTLTANAKGFAVQKREEISLSAGQNVTINIGLTLAGTESTVLVTVE